MSVRGVRRPLSFHRSQMVFEFMEKEVGRMVKRSEERLRKKKQRSEKRKLLAWMDTDYTEIPEDVIYKLDETILQRKKAVQAKWTPRDEAQRSDIDVSDLTKLFMHDGRLFPSTVSTSPYSSDIPGE